MTPSAATREVGVANDPLLRVKDVSIEFSTRRGRLRAVNGVSLELDRGKTLCIVGESGAGKSTGSMAVAGLSPDNASVAGSVTFGGRSLLGMPEEQLCDVRGRKIGVIFQDPSRSLNPVFTIGRQIGETLERHLGMTKRQAKARAIEVLADVGMSDPSLRADQYPHELSGGLKQRAMIAIAIACEPDLLIADEPTTALDVTVQAQVLRLLRKLRDQKGLALILVTHDFGVVAAMADRVAVMYAGRIVEFADAIELFEEPRHPYTAALLESNPRALIESGREDAVLQPIPGSPPDPLMPMTGCSFAARCTRRSEACSVSPDLTQLVGGRSVACWNPLHA